jgi:hypothetical protein
MITAIVRFPLPHTMSPSEAKTAFVRSAPRFQGVPGLIRKYYLYGPDHTGGGVYLWENRKAAEALYTEAWRQGVAKLFGQAPDIVYYETPVIVDNLLPAESALATGS